MVEEIKKIEPQTSLIPRDIIGVMGEICISATTAKRVGVNRQATSQRQSVLTQWEAMTQKKFVSNNSLGQCTKI